MAGLNADFQPPPRDDVLVGNPQSAVGRSLTSIELANQRVSRIWAGWFTALYRRFSIARFSYREITASSKVVPDDCTVIAKITSNITITLLDANLVRGQVFYFKNRFNSAGAATFATSGTQTIDDVSPASVFIAPGEGITLVSDGSNWIAIARYYPPPSQIAV